MVEVFYVIISLCSGLLILSISYHSVSDTRDNSANNELSGGLVALKSRDLNNDTDNHNNTTPHHLEEMLVTSSLTSIVRNAYHLATTKAITESQSANSTNQTSDLINSSDETLVDGSVLGLWKVRVEWLGRNNTRHDTLIISEKQETSGSHNRDSHSKLASVKTDKLVLVAMDGWVVFLEGVVNWCTILLESISSQTAVVLVGWVVLSMLLIHGVLVRQHGVVDVVSRHFVACRRLAAKSSYQNEVL